MRYSMILTVPLSGSDTVDLTTTAATYAETAQLNLYRVLRKLETDNWIE